MSVQQLRPYQQDAVNGIFDAIEAGDSRILFTQPTGTGKTTTLAETVRILQWADKRVLILAHRGELVQQLFERVQSQCDLSLNEIGVEKAEWNAPRSAKVICGTVQSIKSEGRLDWFKPDVVMVDECHHATANTYGAIFDRYGVGQEGGAILLGTTATPKRTDRTVLCSRAVDGTPVQVFDKKTRKKRIVDPSECVFHTHAFDYSILQAIDDGYSVPIIGETVPTDTDISQIKTKADGDYSDDAIAKAVDNAARTILAINKWKEVAEDRITMVFCATVEHAAHSAELWQKAGYKAAYLHGETDDRERFETLRDFKRGKIQVLCSMNLLTEGFDAPVCRCIVMLRPTKAWGLYVQCAGRGLRVLPDVIEGGDFEEGTYWSLQTPDARKAAIAASLKPNCILIDMVDISESMDLCAAPSILDLPPNLDLQGHSLTEAKQMLDLLEEAKEMVIGSCPVSFKELQVLSRQVELIRSSKVQSAMQWKITEDGYRYAGLPVGYIGEITPIADGAFRATVRRGNKVIFDKEGKPRNNFDTYLSYSARHMADAVEQYKADNPINRDTCRKLTEKQLNVLTRRGHSPQEIDTWPYPKAKATIGKYMNEYNTQPFTPLMQKFFDDRVIDSSNLNFSEAKREIIRIKQEEAAKKPAQRQYDLF